MRPPAETPNAIESKKLLEYMQSTLKYLLFYFVVCYHHARREPLSSEACIKSDSDTILDPAFYKVR